MNIYHICQNSGNKFVEIKSVPIGSLALPFSEGEIFTDRPSIINSVVQLENRMTVEKIGVTQLLPDFSRHKNVDIRKCNGCGTYIALETD